MSPITPNGLKNLKKKPRYILRSMTVFFPLSMLEAHLLKHHLYVCHKDNPELRRHLALRDFLRKNPEYCEKYSRIKIEMAKKYPHDIDSYIKGKEPVIKEIYQLCGIEF